jgi:hypothetical protein
MLNPSSLRSLSSIDNFYRGHRMNRVPLMFVLFLAFGWIGVRWTTAQTAPSVPAQAPATARSTSTVAPSTSPLHATANTPALAQPVRPNPSASNQTTQEPEQTKVARIYRGDGFFDAGLAKKLQPVLAQAFGVEPATDSRPGDNRSKSPDLLRSIFGQNQGANQNALAKTGQP